MKSWPVQDAKARFSEFLDACLADGPQIVTKRGTEAAVLAPAACRSQALAQGIAVVGRGPYGTAGATARRCAPPAHRACPLSPACTCWTPTSSPNCGGPGLMGPSSPGCSR